MKFIHSRALPAFLLIVAAQLACTIFVGGPTYPATPITVSTEAVASFNGQLQAAQTAAATDGSLTVNINETQATSLLASYLDSQSDPFIQDPQVVLRDGQIQIYGKASSGNLEANVRIVLSVSVDANGQPVITVTSSDFGPLPSPKGLNDTVSGLIAQAFTGTFGPAATGLRLETIHIADGTLTLTGRVK